ncbi:hypothetical protein [Anaeromyxobacter paludicola]|uniref:Uncharacterized protein n=1 Tax=Anaeromyxobacter paludicola TaxID=2918171 RepID=A0ABM7X6Y0_9BACT|nr:hypothetical protein [Anaeromyxobacter paludicola]BDG07601.1 hypothetical protein AMPC_07140 [Anaeromyxobacter paludicola]
MPAFLIALSESAPRWGPLVGAFLGAFLGKQVRASLVRKQLELHRKTCPGAQLAERLMTDP